MSKDFKNSGFLFGGNSIFIEELYQKYLLDPASVDPSWIEFFKSQGAAASSRTTAKVIVKDQLERSGDKAPEPLVSSSLAENSLKARFMIKAYREHGHYLAKLDPLGLEVIKTPQELNLTLADFGFSSDHLAELIDVSAEFSDIKSITLGELFDMLGRTYSGSVAVEFSHLENLVEQKWLYERFDNINVHGTPSPEERQRMLKDLVEVEGFEQYLHVKFPGAKRFSIEGGDAAVVCLDRVIDQLADAGVEEAVLGLAHRGRLSTLAKVMRKPYRAIFAEFLGSSAFPATLDVAGDVKYHMGYSSDKKTASGKEIHLSLTPNPSHLEAVNSVVAGKVRAKQDCKNRDRSKVAGILVHGDAAFCGQGVVAESMVMSGLEAYDAGGIFHLVINNQIGFTANSYDLRAGRYCTEVAKMVGAPIFHVNGDDIEAVVLVTKIAAEYRQKFRKDVVVDIVCYRKYGHNEGDEPMYTQSVEYNVIKNKLTPAAIYASKLTAAGLVDQSHYPALKEEFKKILDSEFNEAGDYEPKAQWLEGNWAGFARFNTSNPLTGVAKSLLQELGVKLCQMPPVFAVNPKLAKLFAARASDLKNDRPVDWATAEQLAFATLLEEKIPIRMTGQDVERGTFSHRHAVLHSQTDRSTYEPLNNISQKQARFEIADSNLSEFGVLGFEYGYSLVDPNRLVIWEAQFGDFANGAQVIFDQFISSAETKWLRMSGLVALLPHGMEGQGPEHSSARLERFLQLAAENNMYVTYPTTPASIFHLLRRQIKSSFRKPLIVMSPKSLLRHKLAVSSLAEMDAGTCFRPVIDEKDADIKPEKVTKIILCSGKIYYDLLECRREQKINNIAIIRFEQLYPFPKEEIMEIIQKYAKAAQIVWCQEEPRNTGAWKFMRSYLESVLEEMESSTLIHYIGRPRSASPAVGYLHTHNMQQETLVKEALGMDF